MFLRFVAAFLAAALVAWPAAADPENPAAALLDALGLPKIVQIMREEGMDYGREMAADLLPGGVTPAWEESVSTIYDTDVMEDIVRSQFAESFGETDATPLLNFFTGETGSRIVEVELSARRAMVDDDVEAAAREAFRGLDGSSDPRLAMITEFVQENDLVEANVVGALNASYQFYLGLTNGGALEMTEREILTEVWSQEAETRADTREWLYGFLLMALGPVAQEDLETYVALSVSPEGRAMNRALFAGFNAMYDEISYALGLASAEQMMAQEL
ncbi:DUF2059 domain-containing protein [Salipiger abyssi]|uniref:DUF2059 domain-containing protein n=1 Tax=Salipiger abyssi TaxID=1250539 RepID=UPI001A8D4EEA|nr:DUF2059 domain-containing protein [Salipiger abyssi]MBN9886572.1 DUF2059 domain-containing protein [Salipiger abyssi]